MGSDAPNRLHQAFRIIVVLGTVAAAEALVIGWVWLDSRPRPARAGLLVQASAPGDNLVRRAFPGVDFTRIYPGMSADDIDLLQRESFAVRYVYAPFVEFEPLPVAGRFVTVTPMGFREGGQRAPWPPGKTDYAVFVFGGSTTFGHGVPDADTVVAALEERLAGRVAGRTIRSYNFGRGYYFSRQERALLESLLAQGLRPDAVVFIDGLNDFEYFDGRPELSNRLFRHTAPDLPEQNRPALATEAEFRAAADRMLRRYAEHVRMTESLAAAYGFRLLFVGQPVPFLDFHREPPTYPFPHTWSGGRLAEWGYAHFRHAGAAGHFGSRFVWCGDAFAATRGVLYVDSIHYSRLGAKVLARCIAERSGDRLP